MPVMRIAGLVAAATVVASMLAGSPTASADTTAPSFSVTENSRTDLSHFDVFRYDTAKAVNVSATAAAKIDAAVAAIVQRNVKEALKNNAYRCPGGPRKCGVLDSTLTQLACVGGYLCIRQLADEYWPGAATSNYAVDALVFDPTTGEQVPIATEVGPTGRKAFVASVRAKVKKYQVHNGFYDPIFMSLVTLPHMTHWAPLADGIHIWFDKYVAGPGAAGIVTVTVPYPTGALIAP